MKLRRYFIVGSVVGLVVPALLIVVSIVRRYVLESWAIAFFLPGFLPFGSSEPEQEMSWFTTAAGFALNAVVFGCLFLVVGILRERIASSQETHSVPRRFGG